MQLGDLLGSRQKPTIEDYLDTREEKARRIADFLRQHWGELEGARVLDVGTGSGLIADAFVELVGPGGSVTGTDVQNRFRSRRIRFQRCDGVGLPFGEDSFDIVLSNHVMEHVGGREQQLQHLKEIRRILSPQGILYLAQPNRWSLFEPHYRLPFLSWWPEAWRSTYLRLLVRLGLVKGAFSDQSLDRYEWRPLGHRQLRRLVRDAGFVYRDVTLDTLRVVARDDIGGWLGSTVSRLPDGVLKIVMPVIPALIFLCRQDKPHG